MSKINNVSLEELKSHLVKEIESLENTSRLLRSEALNLKANFIDGKIEGFIGIMEYINGKEFPYH